MMRSTKNANGLGAWAVGALCMATLAVTGCQSDYGGQVLPSPSYQLDDVQYFAPGPEFKLSREAAALKAFASEQDVQP